MKTAIGMILLMSGLCAFANEPSKPPVAFKCGGLIKFEDKGVIYIRQVSIELSAPNKDRKQLTFSMKAGHKNFSLESIADVEEVEDGLNLKVNAPAGDPSGANFPLLVSIEGRHDVDAPLFYWVKIGAAEGALTCNK